MDLINFRFGQLNKSKGIKMRKLHEFHQVHAASEALAVYKKTGSLDHLKAIPINSISRYDVWQCVFNGEENKPAFKILQEKELYNMFLEYKNESKNIDLNEIRGNLGLCKLQHLQGDDVAPYALTPEEGLKIIMDCMGEEFHGPLLKAANWVVNTRQEIMSKYTEKNDDWINQAIQLRDMIQSFVPETKVKD